MLLFSKKIQKIEFFKTPSFDFDDTPIGCCPHVWYCNPCLRNLQELSWYIDKISAYVCKTTCQKLGIFSFRYQYFPNKNQPNYPVNHSRIRIAN